MAEPRVLILGHSFIRRLHELVRLPINALREDFEITTPMNLRWHKVGWRTVATVIRCDLEIVRQFFAGHCYSTVGYERYQWSFNPFCSNCRFTVRGPNKAITWTIRRNRGLRVPNYTKRERALKRTHSHVDGLFARCPTAPSICILLETQGILEDNTVILIARWSSSEPTWTV